jgi:hypothetical protein
MSVENRVSIRRVTKTKVPVTQMRKSKLPTQRGEVTSMDMGALAFVVSGSETAVENPEREESRKLVEPPVGVTIVRH